MLQNKHNYNVASLERNNPLRNPPPLLAEDSTKSSYVKDSVLYSSSLNPGTGESNTTSKKIAYINITGDSRPVGPIGIKKTEKDLIMRRYKYNH